MGLRKLIVALFGLETDAPKRGPGSDTIGIFPILSERPDRLVAGFDDKHLDFRVLVNVSWAAAGCRVTVTTVVRPPNLFGRLSLGTILPFHRLVVRSLPSQVSERPRPAP
jgi:hypothetical protein